MNIRDTTLKDYGRITKSVRFAYSILWDEKTRKQRAVWYYPVLPAATENTACVPDVVTILIV